MKGLRPLPILVMLAALASTGSSAPPTGSPKLSPKDFRVLPFCGTLTTKRLDPKDKGIFDELKVTTSDRIRIHGKKERDTDKVGAASHYHLGKLALAPPDDRTGTLVAKVPSSSDAIGYYIVLEVGNALASKRVSLEKGKRYTWSVKTDGPNKKLSVVDGASEVASVVAPAATVTGVGFAATARWIGNEADLAVEFD